MHIAFLPIGAPESTDFTNTRVLATQRDMYVKTQSNGAQQSWDINPIQCKNMKIAPLAVGALESTDFTNTRTLAAHRDKYLKLNTSKWF